ncbi:riboflavin synthase [Candidatus Vallotia cooleyia]|uniref:riboflavin synthase n=1 Tax=Candidatus Vallotiella adelgis TaxID=1177211 RepID=UPI001D01ED2A|nr:riboflavin synthase [Candidatus Vallotia cooleyia]UDG82424.1 Riboflavin synthase [Candidatus Vallotia cooleyia]
MFTGIIAAIGRIESVTPLGESSESGVHLSIATGALDLSDIELGDSISVQGVCLTVVDKTSRQFETHVSRETLNCTVGLAQLGWVNLEKALCANQRLGGHLVSGHVDGRGEVIHFNPVGESYQLCIVVSSSLAKYFAYKGSVTINGVSLTVNTVHDRDDACEFSINLIQHTIQMTTLRQLRIGEAVNLEVDMIARYVGRMLSASENSCNLLR